MTLSSIVINQSKHRKASACVNSWDRNAGVTAACTFNEFARKMSLAASWLTSVGLQQGDFCALLAQNSPAYLHVSFGAIAAGAISMNMNWQQPSQATLHLLEKHGVVFFCTCRDIAPFWNHLNSPMLTGLRHLQIEDFSAHEATKSVQQVVAKLPVTAPAAVFFTSGTTGLPKAVLHTHHGLVWHATKSKKIFQKHGSIKMGTICFTPFFHVMGFVANCIFNICAGVAVNVQSSPIAQKLTPELVLAACHDLKPSLLNTVPWIMEGMAHLTTGHKDAIAPLRELEAITYGGAALPIAGSKALTAAGVDIMSTYGQTELAGPVLFGLPGGDPWILYPWVEHKLEKSPEEVENEGELVLLNNLSTTAGYLRGTAASGFVRQPPSCWHEQYHTGDRFCTKSGSFGNGLVYVCRKDDLIKHVTGEFTNPLVTEHEMVNAGVGIVHAACMIGSSQPNPWLAVELCDGVQGKQAIVRRLRAALESANAKQPRYSLVHPRHVIILQANSLDRTVKGTIQRAQAEARLLVNDDLAVETLQDLMNKEQHQLSSDNPQEASVSLEEPTVESRVKSICIKFLPSVRESSFASFAQLGLTSVDAVEMAAKLEVEFSLLGFTMDQVILADNVRALSESISDAMRSAPESNPYDGLYSAHEIFTAFHPYKASTKIRVGRQLASFNSLGFRGPEIDYAAKHDIFVFGTSDAMGLGVEFDDLFANHLRDLIAQRDGVPASRICVCTFGFSAARAGYVLRSVIAQCSRHRPTFVIFTLNPGFAPNDWPQRMPDNIRGSRMMLPLFALRTSCLDKCYGGTSDNFNVQHTLATYVAIQSFLSAQHIPFLGYVKSLEVVRRHSEYQSIFNLIDSNRLCTIDMQDAEFDLDEGAGMGHLGPRGSAAWAHAVWCEKAHLIPPFL